MKELTIVFDNLGHKELEEYLLTVKGIKEVSVKNDHMLEIDVKYDSKEITPKVIETEIELFLDIAKNACMHSFDKHEKNTKTYHATKDTVCCEYCFMGFIEELFDMDGISKASSNFTDFYFNENGKLDINIEYNPDVLSEDEVIKIIDNLNE